MDSAYSIDLYRETMPTLVPYTREEFVFRSILLLSEEPGRPTIARALLYLPKTLGMVSMHERMAVRKGK